MSNEAENTSNGEKFTVIYNGEQKEFDSPEEAAEWLMAHFM